METIEAVLYINLDRRKDRRKEIEQELIDAGFQNIVRIEAIPELNGNLGCSKSHAKAVQYAITKQYKQFFIVEDDFQLLISPEDFRIRLEVIRNLDYDLVMVAHNTAKSEPQNEHLVRIKDSQTRCGQIVNQKFANTLLLNFKEAVDIMTREGRVHHAFGDQHWKILQPNSKWFAFMPRIAKQRASYSDNENAFADQGV